MPWRPSPPRSSHNPRPFSLIVARNDQQSAFVAKEFEMNTLTFTDPHGTVHAVEGVVGRSVMDHAVNNDVPGIVAECGGEMNCGTCHVFVDQPFLSSVPEKSYDESDMLDVIPSANECSRLSCQLIFSPELNGLHVKVADNEL
jgi:2Fe-2S ferredoxin